MAIAFEFLGISPMGFNGVPAMDPRKDDVAFRCGQLIIDLLRKDLRPKQIITRASLENAIAAVATTGGSTNAVLHLLAIAAEALLPRALPPLKPNQPNQSRPAPVRVSTMLLGCMACSG